MIYLVMETLYNNWKIFYFTCDHELITKYFWNLYFDFFFNFHTVLIRVLFFQRLFRISCKDSFIWRYTFESSLFFRDHIFYLSNPFLHNFSGFYFKGWLFEVFWSFLSQFWLSPLKFHPFNFKYIRQFCEINKNVMKTKNKIKVTEHDKK